MKKYTMTLIAAASLALPVVALAQQGVAQPAKAVANVQQEDRGGQEMAEKHGQVQGAKHDGNDNEANENEVEEADDATPSPTASPSPKATPAVEDRSNSGRREGNDDAEVHPEGRGTNSGHNDGSRD